jgi:hypothetical protein
VVLGHSAQNNAPTGPAVPFRAHQATAPVAATPTATCTTIAPGNGGGPLNASQIRRCTLWVLPAYLIMKRRCRGSQAPGYRTPPYQRQPPRGMRDQDKLAHRLTDAVPILHTRAPVSTPHLAPASRLLGLLIVGSGLMAGLLLTNRHTRAPVRRCLSRL